MPLPRPAPGLVISYSYLWHSEGASGASEARKHRPCVIVAVSRDVGGTRLVYVAPITHTSPARTEDAVKIPPAIKRRLGLDREHSWVVTSELNRFVWPGYDLRPVARSLPDRFDWGYLPTDFFNLVKRGILEHRAKRGLKVSQRD